jgi:hypothetical protein
LTSTTPAPGAGTGISATTSFLSRMTAARIEASSAALGFEAQRRGYVISP